MKLFSKNRLAGQYGCWATRRYEELRKTMEVGKRSTDSSTYEEAAQSGVEQDPAVFLCAALVFEEI